MSGNQSISSECYVDELREEQCRLKGKNYTRDAYDKTMEA